VTEDNPVRIVEAFIDELDLAALGFAGIVPEVTGRPAYHPATRLKIYTCPAGQHLTKGQVRSDRRDTIDHYRNLTACSACALKPRCTPDTHNG
jgi:hypothetical protein